MRQGAGVRQRKDQAKGTGEGDSKEVKERDKTKGKRNEATGRREKDKG